MSGGAAFDPGDQLPGGISALRVLELLPDPVLLLDAEGALVWGNAAAEQVFGWVLAERQGRSVLDLIHPDDRNTTLLALGSVQHKDLGSALEVRVLTASDEYRLVEVRGRSAAEVEGVGAILLVVRDLTDRRRWEFARGDVQVFQTLLEYSTTITLLLDPAGTIRSATGALPRQLGHDAADAEGRPFQWLAAPEAADELRHQVHEAASRAGVTVLETSLRHANGDAIPHELHVINLIDDPVVHGLVVTALDITELHRTRERLSHLATHDPLTQLPNRLLFDDRLRHALRVARRRGTNLAVFFCDLEGFKRVNDAHGHPTGDEVLVETGHRLRRAVRAADTVARMGGDEFVVLAEDVTDDEVAVILHRLCGAFADPVTVQGREIHLNLDVGHAVGDGVDDERTLLARADAAMYRQKLGRRPSR